MIVRPGFACRSVALVALLLPSCAQQPAAPQAFTVRQIDTLSSRGDGAVRIKLQTPGTIAEADADLLVNYVEVVAVRTATAQQRQIAQTRARAAWRKLSAQRKPGGAKPRYLAVATKKSVPAERGAPSAAASVMLWNTETEEIVGTKVYDVRSTPPLGRAARLETFTAEYVGSGT